MKLLLFMFLSALILTDVVYGRKKNHGKGGKKRLNKEKPVMMITDEARLYKYVVENYDRINPDKVLRPVFNVSETMSVMVGLALLRLQDYDEDTNVAMFHVWERYLWKDIFLQWNPEDFGQVDQLHIPIYRIWKPEVQLFNSFDPSPKRQDALAVVSYDGTVLYIPSVQHKIQCSDNSTSMTCSFKFGTWPFNGFEINIDFFDGLEEIDIADYIPNKNYDLTGHPARKNVKYYEHWAEPYPDLTFTAKFRKRNTWWGKK